MVDYPFRARVGGKAIKLNDARHLIASYDSTIDRHRRRNAR